jgi:hypothetical protein
MNPDQQLLMIGVGLPVICGFSSGLFLRGWSLFFGTFASIMAPVLWLASGAPSGQGAFGLLALVPSVPSACCAVTVGVLLSSTFGKQ